ncbi:MAG: 30S ribosomal protein S17 [Bacteroidetes bacterium QH_2_64_26]|nr:MAG: 30S ribosomal protein S17 [Bacteroidetes bacterium QH_10_64_19]PSQ72401.1 MAG: 30S ribosomal protein S17 [Bacteroidetes bacterium QH_2_64_26]PSQ73366.1 MAG: 30S ribosomal protein S17 [Bacteroidetes bacterium QH_9_64_21]
MEQTEEHTDEHVDEADTQDEADQKEADQPDRNDRKERIGVVESAKMDKSITVSVRRQMKHPMYGKYLERSSTFMAHDEDDEAQEGDTVRVMETRPISKNKRWRLIEIIERAK